MLTPVCSIARLIPFHDAIIEYFCFGFSGSRGSDFGTTCVFGLSQSKLRFLSDPLGPLLANLLNSQPILLFFFFCCFLLLLLAFCVCIFHYIFLLRFNYFYSCCFNRRYYVVCVVFIWAARAHFSDVI